MAGKAEPKKNRRRFLQFGLRTLMLFMLAAAVASWWWTRPEWRTTTHAAGAVTLSEQVRRDDEGKFFRDGRWLIDDEANRRRAAGHYAGDTPRGKWAYYRADGTRELSGAVAGGRPDGEWIAHHPDGSPWIVARYADGALDGEYEQWHAGGRLRCQGSYVRGRRDGRWTHYDDAGRMRAVGEYAADRPQGTWRYWDETGKELPARQFLAGREAPDPAATIEQWISGLRRSDDAAVHGDFAWALVRIGSPAVPKLRELLRDGAAEEQARAAAVLGLLGPEAAAAVSDLAAAIDAAGDDTLRCAAAVALGQIGPSAAAAISALEKLAESNDAGMADVALVALASIDPADKRHAVALLDRHPLPPTRGEWGESHSADELSAPLSPGNAGWFARLDGRTFYRVQPHLAPALAEVLRAGDEERAVAAAAALGAIGERSPAAYAALDVALEDARVRVRLAVVAALGDFPWPNREADESLRRAIDLDADAGVRDAAQKALDRPAQSGPGGFFSYPADAATPSAP